MISVRMSAINGKRDGDLDKQNKFNNLKIDLYIEFLFFFGILVWISYFEKNTKDEI